MRLPAIEWISITTLFGLIASSTACTRVGYDFEALAESTPLLTSETPEAADPESSISADVDETSSGEGGAAPAVPFGAGGTVEGGAAGGLATTFGSESSAGSGGSTATDPSSSGGASGNANTGGANEGGAAGSAGGAGMGAAGEGSADGGSIGPQLRLSAAGADVSCASGVYNAVATDVGASSTVLIEIYNDGNADLNLTGTPLVALTSADPSEFVVSAQPTALIGSGLVSSFSVTFSPHWTGTRSASVSLPNDDPANGSCTFSLQAAGLPTGAADNSTFATTSALIDTRYNFGAAIHQNYLYATGGCRAEFGGTQLRTSVEYATINADGSLGSFSTTTALPGPLCDHVAFTYSGHIFTAGGGVDEDRTPTAAVRSAAINSDGTLSAWSDTSSLPEAWRGGVSLVHNNDVYLVGGIWPTAPGSVFRARLATDGTLGAWQLIGILNHVRGDPVAGIINGRLFVSGGISSGAGVLQTESAAINADGSLGSFVDTTSLPETRSSSGGFGYGDALYLFAGDAGNNDTYNSGLRGTVSGDQIVGGFVSLPNAFSTPRAGASVLNYDRFVYVLGGWNSLLNTYNDVQVASF